MSKKEDPDSIFDGPLGAFDSGRRIGLDGIELLLYADRSVWMVDCGLMMWDKAGMAASTEIRVPFLDLEFMRTVLSIPANFRCTPIGSKNILRDAFKDVLPRSIIAKKKQGFQAPIADWLKGALRKRIFELTFSLPREFFNEQEICDLWRQFDGGRKEHALKLWILAALAGWLQANRVSL
jgi:asparagine synthase (glutamine-hydrolysing)